MADVGHLKRICKDALRVAGAVQETYSSEMLGGLFGISDLWESLKNFWDLCGSAL
jgi:hypothetical protein